MSTQSQYRDMKTPLKEGIESLQKWYNRVDGTSSAYFICLGKFVLYISVTEAYSFKFDEYYITPTPDTEHVASTSALNGNSYLYSIFIYYTNTIL